MDFTQIHPYSRSWTTAILTAGILWRLVHPLALRAQIGQSDGVNRACRGRAIMAGPPDLLRKELASMLTLYTFPTPNGRKASVMLEEVGLPYKVHRVDLQAGENKRPEFLATSPITKIPALVEELPGGKARRLFGSGAILLHFAERTGRLLPESLDDRAEAMSWFMLGVSDLGPTAVDMMRFSVRAPEKIPYAIDLYKGELMRCYGALDERLGAVEFLGNSYSIADIACFPFIAAAAVAGGSLLDRFPNLKRWHDAVAARPAVQRGMRIPD